ncbi:MAG TPA: PCRF domain-containing protein, partial [Jiangellales bacterium]|nr:PCRF domain-containing protein [Jiangellales bacterium]
MAARDFDAEIAGLAQTLATIEQVLDPETMRKDLGELEQQAASPELWDDQERAQQVTTRLSALQADLRKLDELRRRIDDLPLHLELAREEGDADDLADVERELADVTRAMGDLEVRTLLSGEYDPREAVVTIRAEAGGVDAADFADMLMR